MRKVFVVLLSLLLILVGLRFGWPVVIFTVFVIVLIFAAVAPPPEKQAKAGRHILTRRFLFLLAFFLGLSLFVSWQVGDSLFRLPSGTACTSWACYAYDSPLLKVYYAAVAGPIAIGIPSAIILFVVGYFTAQTWYGMHEQFKDHKLQATTSTAASMIGVNNGSCVVSAGTAAFSNGPIGSIEQFGGPGTLVVQEGHVVVLEKNGEGPRVVGRGIYHLDVLDRISMMVPLKLRSEHVVVKDVATKDRILIREFEFWVWHKVDPGNPDDPDARLGPPGNVTSQISPITNQPGAAPSPAANQAGQQPMLQGQAPQPNQPGAAPSPMVNQTGQQPAPQGQGPQPGLPGTAPSPAGNQAGQQPAPQGQGPQPSQPGAAPSPAANQAGQQPAPQGQGPQSSQPGAAPAPSGTNASARYLYPYNERIIRELVWAPGGSDWRETIRAVGETSAREVVGQYLLEEIIPIAGRFRQSFKSQLAAAMNRVTRDKMGIQVVAVDIGKVAPPADAEQRLLEKWLAEYEVEIAEMKKRATIARGEGDAAALSAQESARAESQLQMISTIVQALPVPGDGDQASYAEEVVALRLIQAIEKIGTEHSGSFFLPSELLQVLRLSGDTALVAQPKTTGRPETLGNGAPPEDE
jgi:hypothetical protein